MDAWLKAVQFVKDCQRGYAASMTTRNVSLTSMLDDYVEERVRSGSFQNASEVVRDALRLHKARTDEDARKLKRLNRLIQEGIDDVEAGRIVEVDDLGAFFDELEADVVSSRAAAE
jgi:antitoxin ParD1/3/4